MCRKRRLQFRFRRLWYTQWQLHILISNQLYTSKHKGYDVIVFSLSQMLNLRGWLIQHHPRSNVEPPTSSVTISKPPSSPVWIIRPFNCFPFSPELTFARNCKRYHRIFPISILVLNSPLRLKVGLFSVPLNKSIRLSLTYSSIAFNESQMLSLAWELTSFYYRVARVFRSS